MIMRKVPVDDTWAEGACWIESPTGEVDACQFGDEERETDADGGKVGGFMLLSSEHADCEDEFGGQEHLEEEPLGACHALG